MEPTDLALFQETKCIRGCGKNGGTWISLRSKRFRGVVEQKQTVKRDFRRFARKKNGARDKRMTEVEGTTPLYRFLALAPFYYSRCTQKSSFLDYHVYSTREGIR